LPLTYAEEGGPVSLDVRFLMLMLLANQTVASVPQIERPPLSLSIVAAEETVSVGTEVRLKTTLINITKRVLTIFDTNMGCDYPVEVRDDKGKSAPETEYKQRLRCNSGLDEGKRVMITLNPQQSRHEEIVVTRFYDLSRPGKYFVQVLRKIPKEFGENAIKSNIIEITVKE
jgi:hypothetical protein